jgi:hypothetical protein
MPFAINQDVIQALPPECPDQALGIWILPRRPLCVPKTRFCNSGDEGRRGRAQIQYRPRTGWRDGSERPR